MSYHISKRLDTSFDDAVRRVTDGLAAEGFGILTEIDVKETLKRKLDAEFRNYRILGACNPPLAHQALLMEDKIGTMLPCNVVVQDTEDGAVEVSAVDPLVSMQGIDNAELRELAATVRDKLARVVEAL